VMRPDPPGETFWLVTALLALFVLLVLVLA
jgi:hypothetical protein